MWSNACFRATLPKEKKKKMYDRWGEKITSPTGSKGAPLQTLERRVWGHLHMG